jgi:hypothetical protein
VITDETDRSDDRRDHRAHLWPRWSAPEPLGTGAESVRSEDVLSSPHEMRVSPSILF